MLVTDQDETVQSWSLTNLKAVAVYVFFVYLLCWTHIKYCVSLSKGFILSVPPLWDHHSHYQSSTMVWMLRVLKRRGLSVFHYPAKRIILGKTSSHKSKMAMCVISSDLGLEWAPWIRDVTGLVNGRRGPGPSLLVVCVTECGGIWLMIQSLSLNSHCFGLRSVVF